MIKGTTIIELTDVKTGKKEVIKKQNMVTNAISKLFQPTLGHLSNETYLRAFAPCHSNTLGGILMFDKAIEENENTIFAPAGVRLTACGKYNYVNSTTGKTIGSYNVTKSSYDSANRRMTFVYDFNTSQGNGTIASICLTSLETGNGFYGSDYEFSNNIGKTNIYTTPRKYNLGNRDSSTGFNRKL